MSSINFDQSRKSIQIKKHIDSRIEDMTEAKYPSYHI